MSLRCDESREQKHVEVQKLKMKATGFGGILCDTQKS